MEESIVSENYILLKKPDIEAGKMLRIRLLYVIIYRID